MITDRASLMQSLDKAVDEHVQRILSTFLLDGARDTTHMRAGLKQMMQGYDLAVGLIHELTPND